MTSCIFLLGLVKGPVTSYLCSIPSVVSSVLTGELSRSVFSSKTENIEATASVTHIYIHTERENTDVAASLTHTHHTHTRSGGWEADELLNKMTAVLDGAHIWTEEKQTVLRSLAVLLVRQGLYRALDSLELADLKFCRSLLPLDSPSF